MIAIPDASVKIMFYHGSRPSGIACLTLKILQLTSFRTTRFTVRIVDTTYGKYAVPFYKHASAFLIVMQQVLNAVLINQ